MYRKLLDAQPVSTTGLRMCRLYLREFVCKAGLPYRSVQQKMTQLYTRGNDTATGFARPENHATATVREVVCSFRVEALMLADLVAGTGWYRHSDSFRAVCGIGLAHVLLTLEPECRQSQIPLSSFGLSHRRRS